ncbi:hypothetical protein QWZ13_14125 [Reinekea marina]|nr:hypothetical protein [Reinekea marina]MDN3650053.1 hypothetical protein [Reinekea marina]
MGFVKSIRTITLLRGVKSQLTFKLVSEDAKTFVTTSGKFGESKTSSIVP